MSPFVEPEYVTEGYVSSSSEFLANAAMVREHGEWFVEVYLTDPDDFEYVLRISRRGTTIGDSDITLGLDTLYAHAPYRKRLLTAPTVTQSIWAPGQILASSSTPSVSEIRFNNQDGGLDYLMPENGYVWVNAKVKVFLAHQHYIQETIIKVFDGLAKDPQYSLSEVSLPCVGNEGLFDQDLKQRVYRGAEYGLELFGDCTVTFGNNAALDTRNDMCLEGWFWFDSLPTTSPRRFCGWYPSGPWQPALSDLGELTFRAWLGGIEHVATIAHTIQPKRFYHLAFDILDRDLTVVIFDEETYSEVIETFPLEFASSTRDSGSAVGSDYLWRSASDATFRPWYDEVRLFSAHRTLAEIRDNRFKPLPLPYPSSLVHYAKVNNGIGTTVTDSAANSLHGTISGAGTSTWLWLYEGTEELANTPKQDVWGQRFGVNPQLVNPYENGYCVAGNGPVYTITTYEGGEQHVTDGDAASFRDFITTDPALGHNLTYTPRGLFKLKNTPTLPVSCLVEGYNLGTGLSGLARRPHSIARRLVTTRGPKLTDPDDLDVSSFSTLQTATQPIIGIAVYYTRDESQGRANSGGGGSRSKPTNNTTSIHNVLDLTLSAACGWWGYTRASTKFHVERFTAPSIVPDHKLTGRKIIDITQLKWPGVVYEVIVRYRPNDVPLSDDQIAESVKSTVNWEQWKKPYLEEPKGDDELRDKYAGSGGISLIVDTPIYYQADALALAEYIFNLVGGVKSGWSLTVNSIGLEMSHGQSTSVDVTFLAGVPRLGLSGLDSYYIFTVSDNRQEGQIKLDVWRGVAL